MWGLIRGFTRVNLLHRSIFDKKEKKEQEGDDHEDEVKEALEK